MKFSKLLLFFQVRDTDFGQVIRAQGLPRGLRTSLATRVLCISQHPQSGGVFLSKSKCMCVV